MPFQGRPNHSDCFPMALKWAGAERRILAVWWLFIESLLQKMLIKRFANTSAITSALSVIVSGSKVPDVACLTRN